MKLKCPKNLIDEVNLRNCKATCDAPCEYIRGLSIEEKQYHVSQLLQEKASKNVAIPKPNRGKNRKINVTI